MVNKHELDVECNLLWSMYMYQVSTMYQAPATYGVHVPTPLFTQTFLHMIEMRAPPLKSCGPLLKLLDKV